MNEFKCSCPHCGQHVQGDSQWRGRELLCPACQKTMVVPQAIHVPFVVPILAKLPEDELAGPLELPGWLRIVWQVVLGVLTPLIVSAAMAVTLILGPLAWIAAPILGNLYAFGLARHCRDQPKPTRYWVYIVTWGSRLTFSSCCRHSCPPGTTPAEVNRAWREPRER